jgi:hypothetical protein
MMICVICCGGGIVAREVSVLCGAGGGLTVQPAATNACAKTSAATAIGARRLRFGTFIRVSGTIFGPC